MDYRLGGGHRLPHEFSPPNKRPRGDWDRYSHDSYSSGYGSQGGFEPPPPHNYPSHPPPHMHRYPYNHGIIYFLLHDITSSLFSCGHINVIV